MHNYQNMHNQYNKTLRTFLFNSRKDEIDYYQINKVYIIIINIETASFFFLYSYTKVDILINYLRDIYISS